MTEDKLEVYKEHNDEVFIINDTRLSVNPMDVSLFADNAIYGASFLRSNAVFSYRSKHSREKVILTLPISVSVNTATNDGNAVFSREEGLKVLTQLSNYPFCFVKSARIQSYVAPAGGISSAGFMIFGVEQITAVQDMATPDVLFVEFHLVFSNYTPLAKSFKFRTFGEGLVDYPSASDQFTDAFRNIGKNDYNTNAFLTKLKSFLNKADVSSGAYYDTEVPYSSTVLLAPHMYNVEDEAIREQPVNNFASFNPEEIKTIQISASKGESAPSIQMLEGVANKEAHRDIQNKETINIAWSAISDLSMLGQSALQSIRITKYNKFGKHFISAHKHPVLQYMGKSPSRVEIVYTANTADVYSLDEESFLSAYTHITNILDYNAMMYPSANAYNYLKMENIVGAAMGVKNIVPNQRYITASSARQGTENLTMTFVETNVEEFLGLGKVEQGRERSPSSNKMRDSAVRAFLETYDPATSNISFSKTDAEIITAMVNGLKAMANEFSKGYIGTEFSDQHVWEDLKNAVNSQVAPLDTSLWGIATAPGQLGKEVISAVKSFLNDGYSADIKKLSKVFNERSKYREFYIYDGKDVAKSKLANIQLELLVKTGNGTEKKVVSAGNGNNYVRAGSVDIQLSRIFMGIKTLADLGDVRAKSVLSRVNASSEALNDATISSYTGTNYPDIPLKGISESQVIDPMYFIKEETHIKVADMTAANTLVAANFQSTVDVLLQDTEKLDEIGVKSDTAVREAVFTPQETIDERGYIAENESGFWTDIFGNLVSSTSSVTGTPAQSSFMNTLAISSNNPDWNSIQLDSTQLRAKQVITQEVVNSRLIAESAKQDWIYFLINVAGVESGLGKKLDSGTGAKGLFQIVGGTAKSLGFSHNEVATNFNSATKAAIKYYVQIQKTCKNNGFNNWVDLFVCYNLGETGGIGALRTHYKGIDLPKYSRDGIATQKIASIDMNGSGKAVATSYYNFMAAKFGSLHKYINRGSSNLTITTPGVKKENTATITLTREDISKNYVKATLVDDKQNTGSFFNAKIGSKVVRINIKGIQVPVPPLEKEITILGSKVIKYTEKGQKYGADAREYLKKTLKGGFYVEKNVAGTFSSNVFDMNYDNVATKLLNQGLALPITGSGYSLKDVTKAPNFAGQKDRKEPAVYSAKMDSDRQAVRRGAKPLQDIVEPGTTPVYVDGSKYVENVALNESAKVSSASVNYKPSSTTNSYLPFKNGTGTITSEYGKMRTKAANGVAREGYHYGIDCVPTGGDNSIVAAAKGIVVQAGAAGAAGLRVRIWHDKIGFSTQYFHLKSIAVKQGQKVSQGQVIGIMGGSGSKGQNSYPVHCHYQVGFGNAATGNLVNPFKTTLLSSIPDYSGENGQQGLRKYAEKFLDAKYFQNYKGEDLSKTGKVYTGKGDFFGNSSPDPVGSDYNSGAVAIKPTLSEGSSRGIDNEFSVYNKDIIRAKQLESMLYSQTQGFNASFPVIKAYITVGSDNEDLLLRDSLRLGYYFELAGINSAKVVCNNDENPVDLLLMTLANPSFAMTDDYSVTGKYLTTNMDALYGPEEVTWVADRIKLKPGNKLHIRAGYGNDPNKLHTIFNGIITEMTHDKNVLLNVVCEGFGRELLATQIEPGSPRAAGGEWHNSSTGVIFSQSLLQDGIIHFGTTTNTMLFVSSWLSLLNQGIPDGDDLTDPEAKRLITRVGGSVFSGNDGFGFFFSKGNLKQRLFSNIYAAEIDELQPQFASKLSNYLAGLFSLTEKAGYFYIFEGQTPWEACKEMEYRHPGTLMKPLFYDDRMSVFFGLKEQMYIARDLDSEYMASAVRGGDTDVISADYLSQRHKRMELVTKMHMATSSNNIITNGLTLNSDFCTGVNVLFFEDDTERKESAQDDYSNFEMTVDDNLNFWEYRYKTISMPGTHGKYSSFMYGTTALRREAETMYKGKIVLLGNPSIKAGDFIYIDDEVNKMQGILKVRECMHTFDERGFVTEITPGLYVESSNFFYTSLFLELGLTAQIATMFASLTTQNASFGSTNFNAYLDVFNNYKHLTESTNIDTVNNGVLYNTGYGILPASALTLAGGMGYAAYRTATGLGITSELLKKIGGLGAKGVRGMLTGLSFAGTVISESYKVGRAAAGVAEGGAIARTIASLVKASKGVSNATKAVGAMKIMKTFRTVAMVQMSRLAAHPAGLIALLIGTAAFAYVEGIIQESTLTRQPLMFFPINYIGRPYTAGLSGYKYNSWIDSKLENFERNKAHITRGLTEMSVTRPDSFASTILGLINGNSTSKVADSIETVKTEQALRK